MQQRKPKVCAESAARGAEQESPAADEAPEHPMPRKKKLAAERRWSSVANVVLVAFVLTVPPVVVVLGGRAAAPAVWIAAAKAQLRRGEFRSSSHRSYSAIRKCGRFTDATVPARRCAAKARRKMFIGPNCHGLCFFIMIPSDFYY